MVTFNRTQLYQSYQKIIMPPKRAFVALQDRFVSSLAVACCPTMDLVAVVTLDHQLLVHRTTSWQKLMHIKPSDVGFEMVAMAWRPDGLQLAVGCDEGDVAIFEIESGEIVPERHSSSHHEHCITAMHWAHINQLETPSAGGSGNKRRYRKVSTGDASAMSQSKLQFQRRSTRFLTGYNDETPEADTVLITADKRGFIALWWMGRVLLARFDVNTHFTEDEFLILEAMGHPRGDTSGFRVERVDLAPDLSLLFVFLVFSSGSQDGNVAGHHSKTQLHRMLTLDMTSIQTIHEDVALVSSTVDRVHTIVNRIVSTGRQMTNEWKNATRIFELKMGLIGSLYEKYACEDPPQVDMLSVLVSGITAPALAQYFAQDIQEMSIHRMQKALFIGCDTLRTLADDTLKRDLVDLVFFLSELRGHAKWSSNVYADTLGITISALDDLVTLAQDALVEVEAFTLAIHETRQDFALFFEWLKERIRVHTSSNRSGRLADATGRSSNRDASNSAIGSKSLLDLRRLCTFLQRAAESARGFRKQQPSHSMYKVETTFGNPVSRHLQPVLPQSSAEQPSRGCIILFKCIEDQWLALLDTMTATFAQAIKREKQGCFTVGSASNCVEECHVHFGRHFRTRPNDMENDDLSDGNESDQDAIDWDSLKYYGPMRPVNEMCSTVLMGFRLGSGLLLLVRALRESKEQQDRHASASRLTWSSSIVSFSDDSSANPVTCLGFDFYGDDASKKSEQLAFVLDRTSDGQTHQAWLYLQMYDHVEFSQAISSTPEEISSSLQSLLTKQPTHNFRVNQMRGRILSSKSSSGSAASVIATASRGVLCVTLPPSRLTVFDAEDSEDEDDDDNSNGDEND